MAHYRQTIREAAGVIVGNLTTTGTRVYQSRVWPLAEDLLPCLLIYTRRERRQADDDTMGPRKCTRGLELVIEGIVTAGNATLDDTLDTIAAEVETALAASPDLGSLAGVKDCVYESTAAELRAADGQKPVGAVQLVYLVEYRTTEPDPTQGIA